MTTTNLDWNNILHIVNSLAGPLVTAVAIVAAILFFRSDRRPHTICLMIGCVLIFAQRIVHAFVLLPGLGYFDRVGHIHTEQIVAFNNFMMLLNMAAWTIFVSGLLMVAMARFKTSRAMAPATA